MEFDFCVSQWNPGIWKSYKNVRFYRYFVVLMRCHDPHNSANVAERQVFISISCIFRGGFLSFMRPDTPCDEFPAPDWHSPYLDRNFQRLRRPIAISDASGARFAFPTPWSPFCVTPAPCRGPQCYIVIP